MIKFKKHRHAREGGYPKVDTVPFVEMDSRHHENDESLIRYSLKKLLQLHTGKAPRINAIHPFLLLTCP